MKTKKTLLALCAVLLIAATVFGTLAYLTSADKVTNTFTVGKVAITLDEAPVDVYGEVVEGNRVDANAYKLIPGHEYTKDPTVHVEAGSELCYVFVKVENGISEIEDATNTIAAQITANGWTALPDVAGVYYKEDVTAANAENLVVFSSFTVADNANVAAYADAEIVITAYAVQDDGLSLTEAWSAVKDITVE